MQKFKIAVLLVLLILINVFAAGCISDEPAKTPKLELKLAGTSHKIFAGDTTTYGITVRNNRDENDTITLSVAKAPSGWDVTINQTSMFLTSGSAQGILVVVKSSSSAGNGDHKVRIQALSENFGNKKTLSITTKVIGDSGEKVIVGDKISVNYMGYLENWVIFDTNIQGIALEPSFKKSPDYSPNIRELFVYVGPEDPDTLDSYSMMIEGFWEGVVGMKKGQSRTISFPPVKGYANFVNATVNTTEEVPVFETLTINEFTTLYPREELVENVSMQHTQWQWNMSIDYINITEDVVRIKNQPLLNEMITPYGWPSEVTYKNQSDNEGQGRIEITHHAQVDMEAVFRNFPGVVTQVSDNEITISYNDSTHALANEVLTFDITVTDIEG